MRVFLYLGRRNKKGIKILSVLTTVQEIPATRVVDIKKLNLHKSLEILISKKVHEDRMNWELWIESANNFTDLKKSLKIRGFSDLPICSAPIYEPEIEIVVNHISKKEKINIDTNQVAIKSMLRKKL